MARAYDESREARMTLAMLSEPSDVVTGTLIARLGATETVQLITSGGRLPNGVDPAEGELWRRRLAPRINPGQVERIQLEMEHHGLQLLTPEDLEWPGELQQLGANAPIALWLKGELTPLATTLPGRVAIVGARAATAYGIQVATELASDLAYDPDQHGSAPLGWHRDFADTRQRLRDWVATSGTRLERDRPTRQTPWPGEPAAGAVEEILIADRDEDFVQWVMAEVMRRRDAEALLRGE